VDEAIEVLSSYLGGMLDDAARKSASAESEEAQ
jgi:hypothetical protein